MDGVGIDERLPQPGIALHHDARWDERDVMLYALAVGAGTGEEQRFTTECSGRPLEVLPTFAATRIYPVVEQALASVDWAGVLYAEQSLRLDGVLPVEGRCKVEGQVLAVHDRARLRWS
jgi:hypothetical protein